MRPGVTVLKACGASPVALGLDPLSGLADGVGFDPEAAGRPDDTVARGTDGEEVEADVVFTVPVAGDAV
jgi:hypothetical protein